MVFAGGRPGIYAVLAFLKKHVEVRIGNVEWPAYLDILTQTATSWRVVPFTRENGFHPANAAYFDRQGLNAKTHLLAVLSNPGNPTGHTRAGAELEELIAMAEQENGVLLDEAYEMFQREPRRQRHPLRQGPRQQQRVPLPCWCLHEGPAVPRHPHRLDHRQQEEHRDAVELLELRHGRRQPPIAALRGRAAAEAARGAGARSGGASLRHAARTLRPCVRGDGAGRCTPATAALPLARTAALASIRS